MLSAAARRTTPAPASALAMQPSLLLLRNRCCARRVSQRLSQSERALSTTTSTGPTASPFFSTAAASSSTYHRPASSPSSPPSSSSQRRRPRRAAQHDPPSAGAAFRSLSSRDKAAVSVQQRLLHADPAEHLGAGIPVGTSARTTGRRRWFMSGSSETPEKTGGGGDAAAPSQNRPPETKQKTVDDILGEASESAGGEELDAGTSTGRSASAPAPASSLMDLAGKGVEPAPQELPPGRNTASAAPLLPRPSSAGGAAEIIGGDGAAKKTEAGEEADSASFFDWHDPGRELPTSVAERIRASENPPHEPIEEEASGTAGFLSLADRAAVEASLELPAGRGKLAQPPMSPSASSSSELDSRPSSSPPHPSSSAVADATKELAPESPEEAAIAEEGEGDEFHFLSAFGPGSIRFTNPKNFLQSNFSRLMRQNQFGGAGRYNTEPLPPDCMPPPLPGATAAATSKKNGVDWFTSTLTLKATGEEFRSGTLRDPSVILGAKNLSPPLKANGGVYYTSVRVAKEAAAARAIDCLSFREAIRRSEESASSKGSSDSDTIIAAGGQQEYLPVRLCVEEPYRGSNEDEEIVARLGGGGGGSEPFLSSPKETLHKIYNRDNGLNVRKDSFELRRISVDVDEGAKGSSSSKLHYTAYTATFTCPITGESFQSGTFRAGEVGNIPKEITSAPVLIDGEVYYRNKKAALQAAAARALDCMNVRLAAAAADEDASSTPPGGNNDEEGTTSFFAWRHREEDLAKLGEMGREGRLCAEEPYFASPSSQAAEKGDEFHFLSAFGPGSIRFTNSKDFLHNNFSRLMRQSHGGPPGQYNTEPLPPDCMPPPLPGATSATATTKKNVEWFTSTFSLKATGEEFRSGTLRDPSVIFGGAESKVSPPLVANGGVYYDSVRVAEDAAAARAIDCLSFREAIRRSEESASSKVGSTSDGIIDAGGQQEYLPVRLCVEEPYRGSNEDEGIVARLGGGGGGSEPFLRAPKETLHLIYHRDNGLNVRKDSFETRRISVDVDEGAMGSSSSKLHYTAYTATFTCPVTGESFRSGTFRAGEVGNLSRESMSAPVVIDGEVYYRNKKVALQAAAARALDCMNLRLTAAAADEDADASSTPPGDGGNDEEETTSFFTWRHREADLAKLGEMGREGRLCAEEPYFASPTSSQENEGVINASEEELSPDDSVSATTTSPLDTWVSAGFGFGENSSHPSEIIKSPASLEIIPRDDDADDEEEFDEEFVVKHVPGTGASGSTSGGEASAPATTMERIIEAWVDAPPPAVADDWSSGSQIELGENRYRRPTSALLASAVSQNAQEVLAHALAWYRLAGGGTEPESSTEVPADADADKDKSAEMSSRAVSVAASNGVLDALGKANASGLSLDANLLRGINETEESVVTARSSAGDVELAAQRILRRLLRFCDASAECSPDGQPDPALLPNVSTFNAYVRCISRPTAVETAKAAEELLNDMIDGKRSSVLGPGCTCTLPFPNIETFNAVLASWAAISDEDPTLRRRKVNELYSMLEMQTVVGSPTPADTAQRGAALRPNRRTYLIALSALAGTAAVGRDNLHHSSFSAEEAQLWIDRMAVMADRYADDTLRPDATVYNAPLPWSGPPYLWGPDDSTRALPWDDYGETYKLGFNDAASDGGEGQVDELTREATSIENWLLNMESLASAGGRPELAPDIDTYESAIQAWARTGTVEGLSRAEMWAMRAIKAATSPPNAESGLASDSSRTTPRLQTFHPIIAAWAHCGDESGPERVRQWTERLMELGRSRPELTLRPDGRIRAAPILAWRKYQRALLDDASSSSSSEIDKSGVSNDSTTNVLISDENEMDIIATECDLQAVTMSCEEIAAETISAATKCMDCLESLCSEWRDEKKVAAGRGNNSSLFLLEGSTFAHVVNAWGDAAAVCAAHEAGGSTKRQENNEEVSTSHALSEMMRTLQLFDRIVDSCTASLDYDGEEDTGSEEEDHGEITGAMATTLSEVELLQMRHLLQTSHKLYYNAVAHICAVDALMNESKQSDVEPPHPHELPSCDESYSDVYRPKLEQMLRRSAEFDVVYEHLRDFVDAEESSSNSAAHNFGVRASEAADIRYADLFAYEKDINFAFPASPRQSDQLELFSKILAIYQAKSNQQAFDSGDVIRATMFILDRLALSNQLQYTHGGHQEHDDQTHLYVQVINAVDSAISDPNDKARLLHSIMACAKNSSSEQEGRSGNHITSASKINMTTIMGALQKVAKQRGISNMLDVLEEEKPVKRRKRVIRRSYRPKNRR